MSQAIYEDTNPHDLSELLAEIHQGKSVLPDFQRDFVWEPGAVVELLISMMQSYPAGSILRVRNTKNEFKTRCFAAAPTDNSGKPVYLVLDGQQRLTSLYQAFYGVGKHGFFINLMMAGEGADLEDAVFSEKRASKAFKLVSDAKYQTDNLVLPLERVLGNNGSIADWVFAVAKSQAGDSMAKFEEAHKALRSLSDAYLKPIENYMFPVVTLSDTTDAAAICTIFETLNRTGIKLTPFELLTARFYPKGKNLRDMWNDAKTAFPMISDFAIDPYSVLQSITLRAHDKAPNCKRSTLMALSDANMETHWGTVVQAIADGLELLQSECGVLSGRWLPYSTMLVTLGAVLAKHPFDNTPDSAVRRQKLAQWFWCAALSQRYESAANTRIAEDYTALSGWLSGGAVPAYVANFSFPKALLDTTTPRQRAVYSALMCLIVKSDAALKKHLARDFNTGKTITPALLSTAGIDDHHIFPDDYLWKSANTQGDDVNLILNRTLIDATTNKKIQARAPSDYLGDIKAALSQAGTELLLASHFIKADAAAAIWKDDYKGFLAERRELLASAIASVTGGKVTDDSDAVTT